MRWRSKESESSKCCENDSDLRMVAGLQVPDAYRGGEAHLAEESMVVSGTPSISSRVKVLWRESGL
jgi:hypothetical protein